MLARKGGYEVQLPFMEREDTMPEAKAVVENGVEPCPMCGSIKFNPDCAECEEIREQCLLLGAGIEGFDM